MGTVLGEWRLTHRSGLDTNWREKPLSSLVPYWGWDLGYDIFVSTSDEKGSTVGCSEITPLRSQREISRLLGVRAITRTKYFGGRVSEYLRLSTEYNWYWDIGGIDACTEFDLREVKVPLMFLPLKDVQTWFSFGEPLLDAVRRQLPCKVRVNSNLPLDPTNPHVLFGVWLISLIAAQRGRNKCYQSSKCAIPASVSCRIRWLKKLTRRPVIRWIIDSPCLVPYRVGFGACCLPHVDVDQSLSETPASQEDRWNYCQRSYLPDMCCPRSPTTLHTATKV